MNKKRKKYNRRRPSKKDLSYNFFRLSIPQTTIINNRFEILIADHSTSEHGADHSKIRSYYPAGVRQINDASAFHFTSHLSAFSSIDDFLVCFLFAWTDMFVCVCSFFAVRTIQFFLCFFFRRTFLFFFNRDGKMVTRQTCCCRLLA